MGKKQCSINTISQFKVNKKRTSNVTVVHTNVFPVKPKS